MSWQDEMVEELERAANGEKDRVIKGYVNMTGKTPRALYRIAKRFGYESGRRLRCDARECILNDQQILFVFTLIEKSARERKGAIMPVEVALEIAVDNGIIEPGSVSPSWMQTILRQRGMNAEALKAPVPRIQMRSLHPNHVHQLDASVCIQYYLQPGKPLEILPENIFYKNKFENFVKIKRKIIRWVLTDHYSGSIYVKYYQSKGERQEDLFDFLCSAWGPKHEKYPFRGVPQLLMMDAGAANSSKAILAFLARLDVQIPPSMPENPARNGSVEKAQDIVERHFESKLRFQPASSIEELNEAAHDWAAGHNAIKKHTRHGMTRTGCWLRIMKEQLRELPGRDILVDLFANPEEDRTVTSRYSISYRGNEYDVRHLQDIRPNAKVKVILRPYIWPEVGVYWYDKEYSIKPIPKIDCNFRDDAAIIGQEYKAMPETITQQAIKRADNLAYGDEHAKGQLPLGGITVFGHQMDKIGHDYLPRAGTPLRFDRDVVLDKEIPITELFKRMIAAAGPLSTDMNRHLRETYGPSIGSADAERLVDEYATTGTVQGAPKRATAGGNAC